MNNHERQIEIDRMVDGELDSQAQRELLRSCEQQNAWRDLALAYAESQAWRGEFQAISKEPLPEPLRIHQPRHSPPRNDWNSLALVVAILLSLGLGYGLGGLWQDSPQPAGGDITTQIALPSPASPEPPHGQLDSLPLMLADSSNGLKQVDLPIVKASDLDPDWLEQLRSGPAALQQELRSSGLRVHRTHVLAPVRLSNGSRVVVPIEYFIEQDYQ